MIMHPYRTDLNGRDVSDFQDPRGVRIFVEFANALRDRDDAYVEYVWQWKDDPDRLEPKQSYIKKFAPWGWILGTGLYLEDVQGEIRAMAARLVRVSVGITVLCALLLLFVAAQSMRLERRRAKAEDELRESHEKYRALVESATEGTLMVLDGRPAFANPTMLALLDVPENGLGLLDLDEILAADAAVPGPGAGRPERRGDRPQAPRRERRRRRPVLEPHLLRRAGRPRSRRPAASGGRAGPGFGRAARPGQGKPDRRPPGLPDVPPRTRRAARGPAGFLRYRRHRVPGRGADDRPGGSAPWWSRPRASRSAS